MAVVGSAEIVVRAITSKVKADIEKAFKDVRPSIEAQGQKAGKVYSKSFAQELEKNLGKDMRKSVKNATNSISGDLSRDLGKAARSATRTAGDELEAGMSGAGGRAGRKAAQSFSSVFGNELSGSLKRLFNLASVLDILAPAIANLVAGLSAAVSGLFAMAAAASQAAGALAVLPGLFSVVAQAGAAIKLAFGGVTQAIKLGSKAQNAAGTTAVKSAARQATASRALAKSTQALTDAQKELTDAQKALNDARKEAAGITGDQQAAEKLLTVTKANLDQTLTAPGATAADGAEAQKAFDTAATAAEDLANRRAAANKKVIDAENAVDKAQSKVDKAQKARNAAQKASTSGGALSPAVKAANAYQQALAKLTPEARAFVEEVLKMRESFKAVGEAVGKQFFPPLTKAMQLLSSSTFFDILKKNLGQTGGILGDIGLKFAQAFTKPKSLDAFGRILQGNNKILSVFTKSTDQMGGSLGRNLTPMDHLVSLLLKLGQAVQPLTKRFVTWVASLLAAADGAAKVGRKAKEIAGIKLDNGKGLMGFFQRAGDRAAQLGRIMGNLFKVIGDLGKAALPAGDGLLKSFEKATNKLHEFLKTPEQQKVLQQFFKDTADNLRALGDLLNEIGKVFLGLGDNEGPKKFSEALIPAVDSFGKLADKLTSGDVGEAIGNLGQNIADLLNELTQSGQTEVFLKTLSGVVKVVDLLATAFNKIPFSSYVLGFLAINRALSFTARLAGFSKTLDRFKGGLKSLAGEATRTRGPLTKLGNALKAPFKKIGNTKIGSKTLSEHFGGGGSKEVGDAKKQGQSVGHAIADGIAEGIGEHSALVIEAIDKMVKELIEAVEKRLDINSPSRVMSKLGENTGEGFVLGIKEETANAFKAGEQLADAAADGARAGSAGAIGAGKTAAVAATGSVGVPVAAIDTAEKKTGKLAGTVGKLGSSGAKLGGFFKTLGGGLSALVGGPFGLLLLSIPLIIKGFQLLYKNSPAFRKFVDGIVKAVKPLIDTIGKFLLKVLNDFFTWVNSKMPTIKRVIGDVFDSLQPVIHAFGAVIGKVFPVVQGYFKFLFEAIKFYITKILIPVWATVFRIIRGLLPVVVHVFKSVISTVRKTFNGVKTAVHTVGSVIGKVFSTVGSVFETFKSALDKVFKKVRTIVDNIKSAFGEIKGAVTGAFGGLWDAVKGVLGTFVNLINTKLIDGVNKVIGKFGVPGIPHIPGFAEGGYTGPGAKNQFAGVVHADEYVIKKSSRQAIERTHPGLLDTMNKTGMVGVGGGIGFPDIPGVGKIKDLAGETIGGIKNIGEKIAKEGVGKVLETIVKGAESLMGGAGIHRGKLISDFLYGLMDSIAVAAKNWGGKKGQQPGGVIPDVGNYSGPPGGWTSPLRGHYPITQYANRGHNPPWAIDIGAPSGSQVQAASAGIVVTNADLGNRSYGRYIQIAHAHGISTLYAHLAASLVSIGKKVATGQLIGVSGSTGHSTGPHLHFEIKPSHDTLEELRKRGVRLAKGGVARATDGGIPALIAEAGKNERVEPLDSKGLSKRDKEILKMFEGGRKGDLTVNIHNPEPERASQSVSRAIRDKAFSSGWSM